MAPRTIWKFEVPLVGGATFDLPAHAIVRYVGADPMGALCFWAEFEQDEGGHSRRRFEFVGTGGVVPPLRGGRDAAGGGVYLGTVVQAPFVWHLYEVPA